MFSLGFVILDMNLLKIREFLLPDSLTNDSLLEDLILL